MASICTNCNEPILSPEFIKCDGICSQYFHSKCVALNKTTLNAITRNSNVHWLCHDCNNSKANVKSSVDSLRESVEKLTKSLSVDLSGFAVGFKTLSEALVVNMTTSSNTKTNQNKTDFPTSNKRGREDSNDDIEQNMPRKKIVLGSNEKDMSIAAVSSQLNIPKESTERR